MFKRSFFPFSHRNTFIKKQQYSIKKCYLSTSNTIIQRKDDNCKEDASIVSIRNYIFPLLYKEGIKKNSVRLGTAFTLLIASKLLTIQVPLLFKEIIDSLSLLLKETSSSSSLAFPIPFDVWSISVGGILLAYASARIASSLSSEVKNYLFSSISLDVQRRIARESFSKLHSLPLSFHQGRDVGGLGY
jgi:ABC-type multidrug transport system fused ATPase/permease subunit